MTIELADRLTTLRKTHAYSQEDLADKLGVTRQAVSKWERAEASPDTDNLIALARLYGVTLDELITGASAPAASSAVPDSDPIDPENPLPNGSFFDHLEQARRARYPYPVLVAFIYLAVGCCFNLWHPGWIIFLTIPLYYLPKSESSPLKLLTNPVMIVIIYLLLGFQCHLWHPGWLIFFAIPLLNGVLK